VVDSPAANPSRSACGRAAFGRAAFGRATFGRAAFGLAILSVSLPLLADAQTSLRALHVRDLSMRADKTHVRVHEPFHLAIHVHVNENVAALDELVIPDVGTMQMLGDERHTTHSAGGTDVVETLTLEPTLAGRFTFKPAYLDAIDARDRQPKRFSASRPVTVVVDSGALLGESVSNALRQLAAGALIAVGAGLAIVALIALARRRRRRRERPDVPVPAPAAVAQPSASAPPPSTPRDAVAAALGTYRVAPAAAALSALRAALFAAAGVASGVTLRDALGATNDHGLRGALLAAERTMFGPAHVRDAASVDLIDATEAWLR
jgi:hypothetical protein